MTSTLVDHLWQSTLFALLAAALAITFRTHGAHVRYWIWFAASVKFLVPFAALGAIGKSLGWNPSSPGWAHAEVITHPMSTFVVTPVDSAGLTTLLLSIWGLGSTVVIGFWWVRWQLLHDEMVGAKPLRLKHLVGCGVDVREAVSIGPGVVGFFQPLLVLPRGLTTAVAPEHLRPVLKHELAHLRRQDNLTALVHMLVEAAFWFHPLVWLIGARLLDERERACDEAVVASGETPEAYANAILEVCRFQVTSPLPCAAGISSSGLKRRIREIAANRRLQGLTRTRAAFLLSLVGASLALPVVLGAVGSTRASANAVPAPTPSAAVARKATPAAREPLPIVRVSPVYPPGAQTDGIEGWVDVDFTITSAGTVKDAFILAASEPGLFDDAALNAVVRWRYYPVLNGGQPTELPHVRTRIAFQLAK